MSVKTLMQKGDERGVFYDNDCVFNPVIKPGYNLLNLQIRNRRKLILRSFTELLFLALIVGVP